MQRNVKHHRRASCNQAVPVPAPLLTELHPTDNSCNLKMTSLRKDVTILLTIQKGAAVFGPQYRHMKIKKRTLILSLLLVLLMMISGCSAENNSVDSTTSPAEETSTAASAEAVEPTEAAETVAETSIAADTIEAIEEIPLEVDVGDPDDASPEEDAGDPDDAESINAGKVTTITASSLEGSNGYVYYVCEETGRYEFTSMESEGVTWLVYILDEEFDDGLRYIPQVYDATLEGDGQIDIKAGQHIYIYCSCNGFTGEEAPDNCQYFFQRK